MRVAVVYCKTNKNSKLEEISSSLSKGIQEQGHQVDLIDITTDGDKKLTFYEYLALGTESTNTWGGKIPDSFRFYLRQSGSIGGKKTFAFTIKKGIRKNKTLTVIMKALEQEGLFLKYSEVLSSKAEAQEIGKRLHIK